MPKFKVKYHETVIRVAYVEADDAEHAEEIVNDGMHDDFEDVDCMDLDVQEVEEI